MEEESHGLTAAALDPERTGFFCFMMVLPLLWVQFMVPETKGRTLEELEKTMMKWTVLDQVSAA